MTAAERAVSLASRTVPAGFGTMRVRMDLAVRQPREISERISPVVIQRIFGIHFEFAMDASLALSLLPIPRFEAMFITVATLDIGNGGHVAIREGDIHGLKRFCAANWDEAILGDRAQQDAYIEKLDTQFPVRLFGEII